MTQNVLEPPTEKALGLRPRLLAAGVFAIAAAFPVILFFFMFGSSRAFQGSRESTSESLWFFGIVPISAAALCGFTVGSRLADGSQTITDFRAAARGVAVALLSYVIFFAVLIGASVLGGVLSNQSQNQYGNGSIEAFLFWIAVMFVAGLVSSGWLMVIAGAFAGLLLKYISSSFWCRQRWNTSTRVPASHAIKSKIVVGLLFMATNLIYVLLIVFKVTTRH